MATFELLSFFENTCYFHCAVPRITTTDGKIRTVGFVPVVALLYIRSVGFSLDRAGSASQSGRRDTEGQFTAHLDDL